MAIIRPVYLQASERLDAMQDAVQQADEHIQSGTLTSLDTPEQIKKRVDRLLKHPITATVLRTKGVEEEIRSHPVDQLSEAAHGELEAVIDGSDFMPVWFLSRGAELRRTVAKIRARCSGGGATGTGFLIGPRLLLTNYHVLDWTDDDQEGLQEVAAASFADFDVEELVDGGLRPTRTFRLQPSTLLLASPWHELDYALVALEPRSQGDDPVSIDEYGYNRVTGDLGKILKGESVFIIQHPNGQPKTVVIQNNHLKERQDESPYLSYEADTDFGSSGSPVFNRQWEVVALHHAVQIARKDGVILAKDGSPWNPAMGKAQIQFLGFNEGIRISYIVKDLARKRDAILSQGPAALASPECCTAEGLKLLEAALQFQSGMSPEVLSEPLPPRKPYLPSRPKVPSGFPRPD